MGLTYADRAQAEETGRRDVGVHGRSDAQRPGPNGSATTPARTATRSSARPICMSLVGGPIRRSTAEPRYPSCGTGSAEQSSTTSPPKSCSTTKLPWPVTCAEERLADAGQWQLGQGASRCFSHLGRLRRAPSNRPVMSRAKRSSFCSARVKGINSVLILILL